MIDLRSDTLTKPDEGMMKAIAESKVGDDVFGEDTSTNELQDYMTELFSKESALFVSSGVMGNQLGIKALTEPGDEVIVEAQSHIFYYETSAPSVISNIQLNCVESERGMIPIEKLEKAIRPKDYYFPKTKLICLENTHNRHSGTILDIEYIKDVSSFAKERNLKMHLDGARLWNAIEATGISAQKWSEFFDTVTVCFSKGLGAPVGSMLLGKKEDIEKAHKWRKILGGGMRQIGILTSAAMYALNNNFEKIRTDNENAKFFATKLAEIEQVNIDLSKVQTNIVYFGLKNDLLFNKFMEDCKKQGLLLIPMGPNLARAVFYFGITRSDTIKAVEIIKNILK